MEALLLDGYSHPDEVGSLFEAYTRDLLRQAPDFAGYLARQDYSHELSHLEEKYGRPHGRLYLLRCGGAPAGTVALRRIDASRCELKRLYVHPDFRGHGYARRLVETVLSDAAAIGYRHRRYLTARVQRLDCLFFNFADFKGTESSFEGIRNHDALFHTSSLLTLCVFVCRPGFGFLAPPAPQRGFGFII